MLVGILVGLATAVGGLSTLLIRMHMVQSKIALAQNQVIDLLVEQKAIDKGAMVADAEARREIVNVMKDVSTQCRGISEQCQLMAQTMAYMQGRFNQHGG